MPNTSSPSSAAAVLLRGLEKTDQFFFARPGDRRLRRLGARHDPTATEHQAPRRHQANRIHGARRGEDDLRAHLSMVGNRFRAPPTHHFFIRASLERISGSSSRYCTVVPRSGEMVVPVMVAAASLHRKTTTPAISEGSISRGCRASKMRDVTSSGLMLLWRAWSWIWPSTRGVRTQPGAAAAPRPPPPP